MEVGAIVTESSQKTPDAGDVDAVIAAAMARSSRVRELAATSAVRGVALPRAKTASQVRATIEHEVPSSAVAAEGEVLVALGVVPPAFDYLAATVSLMSAELAGYYDPEVKTMYLASDLPKAEREATLSHELVHALQDQHYDLGKLLDYQPDKSDEQSAVHALAEGDATSAMLDELLGTKGAKATDLSDDLVGVQVRAAAELGARAKDVPDILRRSMIAPYVDGIAFVHFLRRRGGWAEVDRVWRAPPVSTEQLLHPEKLLAGEAPIGVPVPVAPDASWPAPEYTDVMGEQAVRLLLEEWIPRVPASEAASGWGGDRAALFRAGERIALAWHLRYDAPAGAARVAKALLRGVEAASPSRGTAPPGGCVERGALGPFLVAQRDRDIVVIAGPYLRSGTTTRQGGSCADARRWSIRILGQR